LAAAIEHRVWPWVRSGALKPQIGLVLPLEQAAQAHLALQDRRVTGKVILTTGVVFPPAGVK
jgi:NADPH:quinone reductase-like Zn-dependent oxidoreductase